MAFPFLSMHKQMTRVPPPTDLHSISFEDSTPRLMIRLLKHSPHTTKRSHRTNGLRFTQLVMNTFCPSTGPSEGSRVGPTKTPTMPKHLARLISIVLDAT